MVDDLRKIGIIASGSTELGASIILAEGEERCVKSDDLVLIRNRNGNEMMAKKMMRICWIGEATFRILLWINIPMTKCVGACICFEPIFLHSLTFLNLSFTDKMRKFLWMLKGLLFMIMWS